MKQNIKTSFELEAIVVRFDELIETAPRKDFRKLSSYRTIFASLKAVGLLEPLVVARMSLVKKYKLLNGHLRLYALKELGFSECHCIITSNNERYTYEAQVNHLNAIQRAKMIKKAMREGISAKELSQVLAIDECVINGEIKLLSTLDPLASDILKDTKITTQAIKYLIKVKAYRQIQIAQLMYDTNNFTVSFAKQLYLATEAKDFIVYPKKNNKENIEILRNLTEEIKITKEQMKALEKEYNDNCLSLTTLVAFMERLSKNETVDDYLNRHFFGIYESLKKIINNNMS